MLKKYVERLEAWLDSLDEDKRENMTTIIGFCAFFVGIFVIAIFVGFILLTGFIGAIISVVVGTLFLLYTHVKYEDEFNQTLIDTQRQQENDDGW